MNIPQRHIRNFSVIAHIDHGKSTLADRLLELTGTVSKGKLHAQHLDRMELERERGVTIKMKPVRMLYQADGQEYILDLIDTPGHVDFSYEVSRALAACEGAVLLVDATQGVQAQTLAHFTKAMEENLDILPVVNKIDHPNADISETKQQMIETFGFKEGEIMEISAKLGTFVDQLLQAIITRIRPPRGKSDAPLRALVFDSHYVPHQGVVADVRVVDGTLKSSDAIAFVASRAMAASVRLGFLTPDPTRTNVLLTGTVGYIETGLKDLSAVRVGDTIYMGDTIYNNREKPVLPLLGYRPVKPMVFTGVFPLSGQSHLALRDAFDKLRLTDASLSVRPTNSRALGNGFRCGFLGLFHAEIVQERLRREYGLEVLMTTPNVIYRLNGKEVENPVDIDISSQLVEEPWAEVTIFTPRLHLGALMQVCQEHRGEYRTTEHMGEQVQLKYLLPLSEVMTGLFAAIKQASQGYASMDYTFAEFRPVDAVRLDILVNHERVDPLSRIVVRSQAEQVGRGLVEKLKEILPRQQFALPIQAAVGGTILARETLPAFRKDVTAKLYGGDRTRKDKLLKKQKKGKKRLARFGKVDIPQEAFFALLKK